LCSSNFFTTLCNTDASDVCAIKITNLLTYLSFTFSRLDHCQCCAWAGSVGIVNFRLGQRCCCINMVGLSQQQHVRQHAQQPMARLTAHKWLMGPWHMHPCWRQRHWHIPELILCVNSIDCLLITYHWRPQLMDSTMPLCYWSCIMPSRRRKHGMLTWGVWLLHDFLVVTEQQKVPCLHANSSISSIHKMGAIQRRRKMW